MKTAPPAVPCGSTVQNSTPIVVRYLAASACVVLYTLPFLRVLTLYVDEGWCLTDAARVYHGQVPFRDFFELVGPGTFYWVAMFFKLLGETWWATRASVLVTGAATCLLIYFLARRLKSGSEIAVLVFWFAISFPEGATVSHHLIANMFALAAFSMVLLWLDGAPSGILFLSGVSAGITFFTMFPKGLLVCAALIATLLLQGQLPGVIRLLSGFMAVIAGVAGYFWSRGGLWELVSENFVWPLRHNAVFAAPYGLGLAGQLRNTFRALAGVVHTIPASAIAFVLWIPFAVVFLLPLILLVLVLCLRRAWLTQKNIPYWIAGSAFWISEMHRPDIFHLVFASPVLIVLLYSFLCEMHLIAVRRTLTASGLMIAGVNLLVCLTAPVRAETPVGSVALLARNPIIDFTNSHVRQRDSMFVYPYSPMYYFLARAVNPTRFSYLVYGHHTHEQMLEAVESLERDRTKYVIWDTTFESVLSSVAPSYRPPPDMERIVEPYLNRHYTEIGREGGIRFLERNTP